MGWSDAGGRDAKPPSDNDVFQLQTSAKIPRPINFSVMSANAGLQLVFSMTAVVYAPESHTPAASKFRVYFIDGGLATQTQVMNNQPSTPSAPNFDDCKKKARFVFEVPVTTGTITQTIAADPFSANGGWFYALGVDKTGNEDQSNTTAPVPFPTTGMNISAPAGEAAQLQIAFLPFQIGGTFYDQIFFQYQAPSPLGNFYGVSLYMFNYQNAPVLEFLGFFSYGGSSGGQANFQILLECDDGSGYSTVYPAHDVTFYLVATSKSFIHRTDLTSAPSIVAPGGIKYLSTALLAPIPTAVIQGAQVQITWNEIIDTTLDHINIYRCNQGTVATPSANSKPTKPFASISREFLNTGINSWTDTVFNTQPTPNSDAPQHQYSPTVYNPPMDFSVIDPAQFQYWTTAVDIAGRESSSPQTTGVIILRGVQGGDVFPGATYRDKTLNCLWNAQFGSNTLTTNVTVNPGNQTGVPPVVPNVAITNVTNSAGLFKITTAQNHGYATGTIVQIQGVLGNPVNVDSVGGPFNWTITVVTVTTFTLNGSAFSGAYVGGGWVGNAYQYWTNEGVGTIPALPQFVSNGTKGTGEVDIGPVTSTTNLDYTSLKQYIPNTIFLIDEEVVLSVYCGYRTTRPNTHTGFKMVQIDSAGNPILTTQTVTYLNNSTLLNIAASAANYARYWTYAGHIFAPGTNYTFFAAYFFQQFFTGDPTGNGTFSIMQPMMNGGAEVASWQSEVRMNQAPGATGGTTPGGPPGGGGGTGGGGDSGGNACPLSGSRIRTIGGEVPVEQLRTGDRVLSYSRRAGLTQSVVDAISQEETKYLAHIGLGPFQNLWASYSHPVAVDSKIFGRFFRRAEKIRAGDRVVVYDPIKGRAVSQQVESAGGRIGPPLPVFRIHLKKGPKNYFSEGVLSHNKRVLP